MLLGQMMLQWILDGEATNENFEEDTFKYLNVVNDLEEVFITMS